MRAVRLLVANVEELASGSLLVLMSFATFGNVVARYFFNNPLEWAEEFSRYAFIWIVFLGAAVCTKHGRHIVIDGLVLALPERVRVGLAVLVDVLILALMTVLAYYGWILTLFTTQPTSTLRVPMSVVYVVVPASAVCIALRSLGSLARRVRSAGRGGRG
ncbi:MAG: TRAP transporter small permease [candidate division NC10 bacterium]|nr:TRAP transporter small permease [candidate division NC10 bacterium]